MGGQSAGRTAHRALIGAALGPGEPGSAARHGLHVAGRACAALGPTAAFGDTSAARGASTSGNVASERDGIGSCRICAGGVLCAIDVHGLAPAGVQLHRAGGRARAGHEHSGHHDSDHDAE